MLCLFLMRLVVIVFLSSKSSEYSYLMGYMVYKYVLLLYGLSFHFLDSVLLSIFFLLSVCALGVVSRNHCLTQDHKDFLTCFLLRVL